MSRPISCVSPLAAASGVAPIRRSSPTWLRQLHHDPFSFNLAVPLSLASGDTHWIHRPSFHVAVTDVREDPCLARAPRMRVINQAAQVVVNVTITKMLVEIAIWDGG